MRLKMCGWLETTLGGRDEVRSRCQAFCSLLLSLREYEIETIEELWKEQCNERGVSADVLLKSEAQLPMYLRTRTSWACRNML